MILVTPCAASPRISYLCALDGRAGLFGGRGTLVGMPSLDGPKNSGKCIANGEGSSQANVGLLMGHSWGEFSAAAAAGCVSLRHAARIVRARGVGMRRVADSGGNGASAMVALLGRWKSLEKAHELCARAVNQCESDDSCENRSLVCNVALELGEPSIISGNNPCDRAVVAKLEYGVRRALPLDVSAPFHCSLMAPVETVVRLSMEESDDSEASQSTLQTPMVMNVDGRIEDDSHSVRELLCAQTVGSVNWVACMKTAIEFSSREDKGATTFIELGPGKVLKGLMAREVPQDPAVGSKPHVLSVSTATEVEIF